LLPVRKWRVNHHRKNSSYYGAWNQDFKLLNLFTCTIFLGLEFKICIMFTYTKEHEKLYICILADCYDFPFFFLFFFIRMLLTRQDLLESDAVKFHVHLILW
jgi:hypothetical protein